MKLLYLANQRLPTEKAYGIQIAEMCEAFARSEAVVNLIIPHRQNKIKEDFFHYYGLEEKFTLRNLYAPDFYFPGNLDKIAFFLKNIISGLVLAVAAFFSDADIVYSRDEIPLFFYSFFKKNFVFEAHTFSRARRFFYRRFHKLKIPVIVISKGLQKEFIQIGFHEDKVLVAYDGVDMKLFNQDLTRDTARARLGLPKDAQIVLYAGGLLPWKGIDVLARAAEFLPAVSFIFVGGMENDIKKAKEDFGEIKNISFVGKKPHHEIPLWLKAANVLALPNKRGERISALYTSPLKLFEYIASRRPIVASNLPSIREILNETNAVLVGPNDPADLAKGVGSLIDDPGMGEKLAERAYLDVQEHTWEKRVQRILQFIGSLQS